MTFTPRCKFGHHWTPLEVTWSSMVMFYVPKGDTDWENQPTAKPWTWALLLGENLCELSSRIEVSFWVTKLCHWNEPGLLQGTLESYLFESCCVDCSKTNFKIHPDCPPRSNLKLGASGLELGGWSLELEAWSLKLGVCSLELGAWSLKFQNQAVLTMIDDWWLVIGDWLMIG